VEKYTRARLGRVNSPGQVYLVRIFFPTIVRLVPWGRGQRWSSKRFAHRSTIWPGW
jgi:hypothetical protein